MNRLSEEDARRRLIEGIHARTLAANCRTLLSQPAGSLGDSAKALAIQGLMACETVSRGTRAAKAQMIARLTDAGVAAQAIDGPEETGDLQFQAFAIDIEPGGLDAALRVSAAEGYVLPLQPDPWTVDALRRFATHLELARPGIVSMRMQLRWSTEERHRPRFTPESVDLALVRLPPALWPLWFLIKPVRVLRERLTGLKACDRLGLFTGAVNLETPEPLIDPLLGLAAPTAEDVLVDLGCGDGRLVLAAARRYGCRAIGVERNRTLASRARLAARTADLADRVTIVEGDLLTADLASASIVVLFLPGEVVADILVTLLEQMQPGSRLVVHEQAKLDLPRSADSTVPLFADGALTVAHVWRAS